MAVSFLRSKRNRKVLIYEDYMFHLNKQAGESFYFRCKVKTCKVKICVKNNLVDTFSGVHNHLAPSQELKKRLFAEKVRERVLKEPESAVTKIYKEEVEKTAVSPDLAEAIPSFKNLSYTLYATRMKYRDAPTASIDEALSGSLGNTKDDEKHPPVDNMAEIDRISTQAESTSESGVNFSEKEPDSLGETSLKVPMQPESFAIDKPPSFVNSEQPFSAEDEVITSDIPTLSAPGVSFVLPGSHQIKLEIDEDARSSEGAESDTGSSWGVAPLLAPQIVVKQEIIETEENLEDFSFQQTSCSRHSDVIKQPESFVKNKPPSFIGSVPTAEDIVITPDIQTPTTSNAKPVSHELNPVKQEIDVETQPSAVSENVNDSNCAVDSHMEPEINFKENVIEKEKNLEDISFQQTSTSCSKNSNIPKQPKSFLSFKPPPCFTDSVITTEENEITPDTQTPTTSNIQSVSYEVNPMNQEINVDTQTSISAENVMNSNWMVNSLTKPQTTFKQNIETDRNLEDFSHPQSSISSTRNCIVPKQPKSFLSYKPPSFTASVTTAEETLISPDIQTSTISNAHSVPHEVSAVKQKIDVEAQSATSAETVPGSNWTTNSLLEPQITFKGTITETKENSGNVAVLQPIINPSYHLMSKFSFVGNVGSSNESNPQEGNFRASHRVKRPRHDVLEAGSIKDPVVNSPECVPFHQLSPFCSRDSASHMLENGRFPSFVENSVSSEDSYSHVQNFRASHQMVKKPRRNAPVPGPSKGDLPENSGKPVANRHKDHFDAYGAFIAAKLRNLDWRSCALVQKAFADILFEAELGRFLSPQEKSRFGKRNAPVINSLHEVVANTSSAGFSS